MILMYECFHCGMNSVVWDSDFGDYGYEGAGVVHICHCSNCSAEIEYRYNNGDNDAED